METPPCQSDPAIGFEPDPVHGFAYCRELPPDVPPGMRLDEWRHAHHRGRRHHHHLRRDLRVAGGRRRGCEFERANFVPATCRRATAS